VTIRTIMLESQLETALKGGGRPILDELSSVSTPRSKPKKE
jgi:hypothetical protein